MAFAEHKELVNRARAKFNITVNWFAYLMLIFIIATIVLDKLGLLGS